MEEQIHNIKTQIAAIQKQVKEDKTLDAETKARVCLTSAFAINGLLYSIIRMQGRAKLIEDHEDLHRQTGDIKARFAKLNEVIRKRDLKA